MKTWEERFRNEFKGTANPRTLLEIEDFIYVEIAEAEKRSYWEGIKVMEEEIDRATPEIEKRGADRERARIKEIMSKASGSGNWRRIMEQL